MLFQGVIYTTRNQSILWTWSFKIDIYILMLKSALEPFSVPYIKRSGGNHGSTFETRRLLHCVKESVSDKRVAVDTTSINKIIIQNFPQHIQSRTASFKIKYFVKNFFPTFMTAGKMLKQW